MEAYSKASTIISDALRDLRQVAQESLAAGDFNAVKHLAELACHLEALADPSDNAEPPWVEQRAGVSGTETSRPSLPARVRAKRKKKKVRKNVPKFYRRSGDLVKVGRSRSKGEYEHRAPAAVVDVLVASLIAASPTGALVRMDDILPLSMEHGAAEIPSYQVYLCLAWLRSEGLVEQQGRQGYWLPNPSQLSSEAQKLFKELPLHNRKSKK